MATLIKPGQDKEWILRIKPKRGDRFTRPELFSYVGVDFGITELMSGDLLLTMHCGELNKTASTIAHREIRGTAMIVEKQEID